MEKLGINCDTMRLIGGLYMALHFVVGSWRVQSAPDLQPPDPPIVSGWSLLEADVVHLQQCDTCSINPHDDDKDDYPLNPQAYPCHAEAAFVWEQELIDTGVDEDGDGMPDAYFVDVRRYTTRRVGGYGIESTFLDPNGSFATDPFTKSSITQSVLDSIHPLGAGAETFPPGNQSAVGWVDTQNEEYNETFDNWHVDGPPCDIVQVRYDKKSRTKEASQKILDSDTGALLDKVTFKLTERVWFGPTEEILGPSPADEEEECHIEYNTEEAQSYRCGSVYTS